MPLPKTTLSFKFSLVAIVISPVLSVFALLGSGADRRFLASLAISLLLFGIGEVINHPRQVKRIFSDQGEEPQSMHRRRNPCLLGNLLVIAAIIFLAVTLAPFISF